MQLQKKATENLEKHPLFLRNKRKFTVGVRRSMTIQHDGAFCENFPCARAFMEHDR